MENLFVFLISFVIVFLIFLTMYFIRRAKGTLAYSKEAELLTARFNLNKKKLNFNSLGIIFSLVNSLIIATVGTLSSMLPLHYLWQLTFGFVLIMIMIYIIYGIIGRVLKRKEKENGKR